MNFSKNLLMSVAIGVVGVAIVACNSTKQALTSEQQVYAGKWVAADGTYVQIFLDGAGSAKGSSSSVEGGSTNISGQTLKIGLGLVEQKYQISQEPKEADGKWTMKLNGITYIKEGQETANSSAKSSSASSSSKPSEPSEPSKPTSKPSEPTGKPSESAPNKTEAANSGDQNKSEQPWETDIKKTFKEQTGLSLKSLVCPEDTMSKVKQGVACEGTDDTDKKIAIILKQDEGKETIGWKANKGLISLKAIEASIRKKLGQSVDADCRGKFKIAHTGDKFTCRAQDTASNQKAEIEVTVQTEDGQVKLEVK
jgi:hypothetical protein